ERIAAVREPEVMPGLVHHGRRLNEVGPSEAVAPRAQRHDGISAWTVPLPRSLRDDVKIRIVCRTRSVRVRAGCRIQTRIRRLRLSRGVAKKHIVEDVLSGQIEPPPAGRSSTRGFARRLVGLTELSAVGSLPGVSNALDAVLPADGPRIIRELTGARVRSRVRR